MRDDRLSLSERIIETIEDQEERKVSVKAVQKDDVVLPPLDIVADTVLGACVTNPDYCRDALARLQADDWPYRWQQLVWRRVMRLAERGKPVNVVTLAPYLPAYEMDLLLRTCAERANPYLADYIGILARLGAARREIKAAVAEVPRP